MPARSAASLPTVRRALVVALGATVCVLAACYNDNDIPSGMTPACASKDDDAPLFTNDLRPAVPVDFVGVRTETTAPRAANGAPSFPAADGGPGPATPATGTVAAWSAKFGSDVRGTPCSGAKDRPACEKKLATLRVLGDDCLGVPIVPLAAPSQPATQRGVCNASYLVYTRGDEVGTVRSGVDARAFFGEIDTPMEALYLVSQQGEQVQCAAPPAAYVATQDGYELVTGSQCKRRYVSVSRSGVVGGGRTEDGC